MQHFRSISCLLERKKHPSTTHVSQRLGVVSVFNGGAVIEFMPCVASTLFDHSDTVRGVKPEVSRVRKSCETCIQVFKRILLDMKLD